MKSNKEFVQEKFYNLYHKKWKAQGKSQKDFANAVRAIDPQCGINKTYVSKLLNGIYTPSTRYLFLFCKVLDVELEEFYPSSYEDKYQYSPEYQDNVAEWQDDVARDCFGLNLSFLYGLKELIDFDSEFPTFSPLECVKIDPVSGFPFGLKYSRAELGVAAEGGKGKGLFQIENGGRVINLSPIDMKYLKMIQNFVIRKVREQFAHHKQELIDSMNEATEQCKDYLQPGVPVVLGQDPLSPEKLQKIDKWGIYTIEEKHKYKISDPPEGLPLTATYIEKGWGFGRGALPPDELRKFFDRKRGEGVPDDGGAAADLGGCTASVPAGEDDKGRRQRKKKNTGSEK